MNARTARALIVVGAAPGPGSFRSVHHVGWNPVTAATALTGSASIGVTVMGVTG
jgi:hypothetical protein